MALPAEPPVKLPIVCNPNTLAAAAACYGPLCLGPDDRRGISVHVRIQELKAVGGPDYTGAAGRAALDAVTSGWLRLDEDTRKQIQLLLDVQNALNKGASFASDVNSLRTAAKCYICTPWEQRENILLFLKCLLNQLGDPE